MQSVQREDSFLKRSNSSHLTGALCRLTHIEAVSAGCSVCESQEAHRHIKKLCSLNTFSPLHDLVAVQEWIWLSGQGISSTTFCVSRKTWFHTSKMKIRKDSPPQLKAASLHEQNFQTSSFGWSLVSVSVKFKRVFGVS